MGALGALSAPSASSPLLPTDDDDGNDDDGDDDEDADDENAPPPVRRGTPNEARNHASNTAIGACVMR